MRYAPIWKRFVAVFIDGIILAILFIFLTSWMEEPRLLEFILTSVYFALFESSFLMATPGKIILGLKVSNLDGEQLSFLNAFGRNLAKWLSEIIFMIGYLFPLFTEKKQALHDLITGCVVVEGGE